MPISRFSGSLFTGVGLSLITALSLTACISEGEATPSADLSPASASISATPSTVLVEDPQQWRDLGGLQLVFLSGNGTPPATGWKAFACDSTSANTYFPGMVRAGTFLVFKLPRISLANFERYWQLTSGAPPMSSDAMVLDRLPYLTRYQMAAVTLADNLVDGVTVTGGFNSRCYQRSSATAPFARGYDFNATPGGGTADAGDGRPYVTELCDSREFAFLEVYVP